MPPPLPPLPDIALIVVDEPDNDQPSFLRLRRHHLRARYPDGTESATFSYDEVDRQALDAVVVAAHFVSEGRRFVFLRSALRPPVALRRMSAVEGADAARIHLWEVPAGLVEAHEQSEFGLRQCASRELAEELGLTVAAEQMLPLGPSQFPAPGIIGERHFYFHCEVDPTSRVEPSGDGSALEDFAAIVAVPLEEALNLVRDGQIEDAKTEITLRRLREMLP